jgi:hypothetical protein
MDDVLVTAISAFCRSRKPVILTGAGISRPAPTTIPLFSEINEAILEALDPGGAVVEEYASSVEDAESTRRAICSLQPERLLGEVQTMLGEGALRFLKWMSFREPNHTHKLVARLVTKHKVQTVLTTNFDLLHEKVLPGFVSVPKMKMMARARILANYDYAFVYDRISVNIPRTFNLSEEGPTIFHLHGSVDGETLDLTSGDSRIPYDEFDKDSLRRRLEGSTVLIVGYSGNDTDDVVPLLTQVWPKLAARCS